MQITNGNTNTHLCLLQQIVPEAFARELLSAPYDLLLARRKLGRVERRGDDGAEHGKVGCDARGRVEGGHDAECHRALRRTYDQP